MAGRVTVPPRSRWWYFLGAAFPFVFAAVFYELIHAFPYGLLYDDGYFYAQIAYNLGTLGRSSFDGINTTSGYHLLWGALLGLVSAIVGIFTADKTAHLYFFQVTFAGVATLMAGAFARRPVDRFNLFMLVLFCTLLMETALLSLLLLSFAYVEITRSGGRQTRPLLACFVAALVPLVRIDATVILLVYCALLLKERAAKEALRLATALAAGLLTQIGLMLWIFGHPFSVAAMIKVRGAGLSPHHLPANLLGSEPVVAGNLVRSAVFFGMLGATLFLASKTAGNAKNRRYLYLAAGAATFVLIHLASHQIPFWCYLPGYMILSYVILNLDLEEGRPRRVKDVVSGGLAVLMVVFLAHKAALHYSNLDISQAARDFVLRIKDHVPLGGRIYQIDGAGYTGYFSERTIVNGDGLVNSYVYAQRIRQARLAGFLDEQGICFIITNTDIGNGDVLSYAGLVTGLEEVEMLDRSTAYGKFPTTDFVLYRRRTPRCHPARSDEKSIALACGCLSHQSPRTNRSGRRRRE